MNKFLKFYPRGNGTTVYAGPYYDSGGDGSQIESHRGQGDKFDEEKWCG